MKTFLITTCLLIILVLPTWGATEVVKLDSQMRVQADSDIEYDLEGKKFTAGPNAKVTSKDILLTADSIEGSLETGEVRAQGHVVFIKAERQLKSDDLTYNINTGVGAADNASSYASGIYFNGRKMALQEGVYTLSESRFTGCNLDHPHYYITAKELTIEPGMELTAAKVTLVILGHKIATLPRYRASLEQPREENKAILPPVSYGSKYGLVVGKEFDLSQGKETLGTLDAGVSSRQLFHLGIFYDRIKSQPVLFRAAYRMPVNEGTRPGTLVTRIPEIGYRFAIGKEAESIAAKRSSLDLSTGFRDVLAPKQEYGKWNVLTEIGAGYFLEEPSDASSSRVEARVTGWITPVRLGSDVSITTGIVGRFSHYGTGQNYGVAGFRFGVGRQFGQNTSAELVYGNRIVSGSTPFDFDRNELRQDLTGKFKFPVGTYELGIAPRFDLNKGSLYDTVYTVSRKFHCLEPSISYRNRYSQVSVGLKLVGL